MAMPQPSASRSYFRYSCAKCSPNDIVVLNLKERTTVSQWNENESSREPTARIYGPYLSI